jgi:acetyl esterase/lipase
MTIPPFFRLVVLVFAVSSLPQLVRAEVPAGAVEVVANIPYKPEGNLTEYEKERCRLDLYLPTGAKSFPSLVWFHGGGMTGGSKEDKSTQQIARTFAQAGIAVAVPSYRLSPKATFPAYVEDAAAAFEWVHQQIGARGGDTARVFIGGHSAGAYLSSMLGMDRRYLQHLGAEPSSIAGLIPVSGQMMTHFTVRKERGLPESTVIADEAAPIYFSRKETPPFLIIMGDHDWPARLEENQYFAAFQKTLGNDRVSVQVVPGRTHGSIVGEIGKPGDPVTEAIVKFITETGQRR